MILELGWLRPWMAEYELQLECGFPRFYVSLNIKCYHPEDVLRLNLWNKWLSTLHAITYFSLSAVSSGVDLLRSSCMTLSTIDCLIKGTSIMNTETTLVHRLRPRSVLCIVLSEVTSLIHILLTISRSSGKSALFRFCEMFPGSFPRFSG